MLKSYFGATVKILKRWLNMTNLGPVTLGGVIANAGRQTDEWPANYSHHWAFTTTPQHKQATLVLKMILLQ